MSNFRAKAFNPVSRRIEDAEYCDDYYGRYKYGIRFDDGTVHPKDMCGIDAAATQLGALQERVKELEAEQEPLVREVQRVNSQLADEMKRATRAEQERDEALERAAKVADDFARKMFFNSGNATAGTIAAAIRRLASGPGNR